jgi:hypothetical protein
MKKLILFVVVALGLSVASSEALTIHSSNKVRTNEAHSLKKLNARIVPGWCDKSGFYLKLDISKDAPGHTSWNSKYSSRPAGGDSQFNFLFGDVKNQGGTFVVKDENGSDVTIGRTLSNGKIKLEEGVDVKFNSTNSVISAVITK